MALLDKIKAGATLQEVDAYLKPLAQKFLDQLTKELAECDSKGMTPLHYAVQKADLAMVKVLLGFDASIAAKIKDKTIEEYASDLVVAAKKTGDQETLRQRKQVYALIKSRGCWQADVERGQGLSLPRSIKAIEEAMEKVRGAEGKTGVLFMGLTGHGKSTLINFLSGVDYEIKRGRGGIKTVVPKSGSAEIARVGNTTISETLFPQVIAPKKGEHVFVDLPGFEDTRGNAEEVCAAASIFMLTKQLSGIQGILFICSWDSFNDVRMVPYRKVAANVGAMIAANPETNKNIVLVVTKPEGGEMPTMPQDVRERLEDLCKDENWEVEATEGPVKIEEMKSDQRVKYYIRRTTNAILSSKNSILIMDVTKPQAREHFEQSVEKLSHFIKAPDRFDFANYSRFMNQFVLVIEQIVLQYNSLARQRQVAEEKLKGIQSAVSDSEKEKAAIEAEIQKFTEQKSQPFTADSFDKAIAAEEEKLRDVEEKLDKHEKQLEAASYEYKMKSLLASSLEVDGEQLIDTLHRGWMCDYSEAREETHVEEVGDPIFVPGMGMAQQVRIDRRKTEAVEKKITGEPVRYQSAVPIQRYIDRSTGGTFTVSGFTPGCKELSGTFSSQPGARGAVALSVELYANRKDFPAMQDKLESRKKQAEVAKNHLDQVSENSIPKSQLREIERNISKMREEKLQAVGNQERTKMVCESQIAILQPRLEATSKRLGEFKPQIETVRDEIEDIQLQIQVNDDLFRKLDQIVRVMGFNKGSEALEQFIRLYANTKSGSSSQRVEDSGNRTVPSPDKASRGQSLPGTSAMVLSNSGSSSSAGANTRKPTIQEDIKQYADKNKCHTFLLRRSEKLLSIEISAKSHDQIALIALWQQLQSFIKGSLPASEQSLSFSEKVDTATATLKVQAEAPTLDKLVKLLKEVVPANYINAQTAQSAFFQPNRFSQNSELQLSAEETVSCVLQ